MTTSTTMQGCAQMADEQCSSCTHRREGVPPDPLMGVRLVSQKVLELRAKWQQELQTRATFEQERLLAGDAFDYEPYAYPYCSRFSRIEDSGSKTGRSLYVLCAAANPNGDCEHFQPNEPA